MKLLKTINPHGIFLSNGPGDPSAMPETVALVKEIVASEKPIFGICIGHQLLAISLGAKTNKMKQGHRGANHPVKNLIKDKGNDNKSEPWL